MSELKREPWHEQAKRIINNIDEIAKRMYKNTEGSDQKLKFDIGTVLEASDVPRSSFYNHDYHITLSNYAGLDYERNKANVVMKPKTFCENRHGIKTDELDEDV